MKLKITNLLFGFGFLALLLVQPVQAKVLFKGGENVDLNNQVFDGETFIGGAMINGSPEVKNDAFIAGSNLDISGIYGDDLNIAGGQVTIGGEIKDVVRAAGGNVKLNAKVGSNAHLAGGQIDIAKDTVIGGDLQVAGGMVTINGEIKGNLRVAGGQVIIAGIVDGDANIEADEVQFLDSAKVKGKLEYSAKKQSDSIKNEQVGGGVNYSEPKVDVDSGVVQSISWTNRIVGYVIGYLMMLIVGLVLLLLAPMFANKSSYAFSKKMGWSLLWGLIVLIVLPIVCVILMITFVGLPLSFIGLAIYFIAWYLSKIIAGLAFGSVLLNRKNENFSSLIGALALGILVLEIVTKIPYLGFIFNMLFVATGIGAMGMVLFSKKEAEQSK